MSTATELELEIDYPSSDGEPMGETGAHVRAILALYAALREFFADRPDVYVAADMFWYWKRGDKKSVLAPDVMVIPGIQWNNRELKSFKAWEHNNIVPVAVFEMASENTVDEDLNDKFKKYQQLGVREYFLFDPTVEHLRPALQGYRLHGDRYEKLFEDDQTLESELGFRMKIEGEMLRIAHSRTNQLILTDREKLQLAVEASRRAEEAEAKLAKLQALLEKHNIPNGNGS
jgi:Uma2 family endonuclease